MTEKPKNPKDSERFALRLPPELNERVRAVAKGSKYRPGATINKTLVLLIERGLEQVEKETSPGNPTRPMQPVARLAA